MPLDSISLRKLAFHEPVIRAATAKAKPGSLEAPRKSSRPTHVRMRRGDTVGGIARQFGVSEREVRRINALPRNYRLRPGQILRLPAS
jgi:LysM repeat protein